MPTSLDELVKLFFAFGLMGLIYKVWSAWKAFKRGQAKLLDKEVEVQIEKNKQTVKSLSGDELLAKFNARLRAYRSNRDKKE